MIPSRPEVPELMSTPAVKLPWIVTALGRLLFWMGDLVIVPAFHLL